MNVRRIRVAVVDDSAFMRIALRQMLAQCDDIEVVAEGRNGREAVEIAATVAPDLMTLDVLMPEMDGIAALAEIMRSNPCPVIMISTETIEGALVTMRALDLGAVDFIAKSTSLAKLDMAWIERHLAEKVRYWAQQDRRLQRAAKPLPSQAARSAVEPVATPELVVVAASTGGPRAVTELVGALRQAVCPILVVQHMPSGFTADFARHLAMRTGREVVEIEPGATLKPGVVAILPGGVNSEIVRRPDRALTITGSQHGEGAVHPSADVAFESVARVVSSAVAVVLTGMGDDGTAGTRCFAARDWPVLVQDPATCVVAGMPQSAIAAGTASEVLTLSAMARRLNRWVSADQAEGGAA